ncbi:MAG TPA: squalene synthase HpnC [Acidimicrobiales bacterium]|nr:squalene synthase HpnC [Acidimicrobiales bacterium]
MATERRYLEEGNLPAPEQLLARSARENFPVASRLLPRRQRDDLRAIYGFARLVDFAGDELAGDRLAALDWIEAELDRSLANKPRQPAEPSYPLIDRAASTVRARGLADGLLRRLIQANRQDQQVHQYPTYETLLAYCELSANPVGRLVLGIFGASTPERERWSDRVCTGLQLAEHWQDVAEDAAAGRIYLPLEDLRRFGVQPGELTSGVSSEAIRGLMAFEVARARGLLDAGTPLISSMHGRARLAVAGFVAGGQAALDGIARTGFDVLAAPARPRPHQLARRMIPALTQRTRRTQRDTP